MQQRGFTLIELIIVIVILGIVAATAAPKFIDVQNEATASTIKGMQAALQSGAQLVFAKSAIAGQQSESSATGIEVEIGGQLIRTEYGYPDAHNTTAETLAAWINFDSTEFQFVSGRSGTLDATVAFPGGGGFALKPFGVTDNDYRPTNEAAQSCHVLYTEPSGENEAPVITVVTGGC